MLTSKPYNSPRPWDGVLRWHWHVTEECPVPIAALISKVGTDVTVELIDGPGNRKAGYVHKVVVEVLDVYIMSLQVHVKPERTS
jgi:hypothetical protein